MKILKKLVDAIKLSKVKQRLQSFPKPYQLHIGCGSVRLDGWLHIDCCKIEGVTDLIWDVSQGFPFLSEQSCSLIYNEHFLEHLSIEKGCQFLAECYHVLQPGGVVRIAMPSLEYTVTKYQSDNWKEQDWLTWKEYQFIKTRAEMLNIAMRWWGHQWLYDREELHRRLKEAGFTIIRDREWGKSDIPELRNLETRKDSILICEAQKS
jgi:predicted SAM-dependent methyltransferase